mgnify:CR=1 FL=1
MHIAIVGYGKMGHIIRSIAESLGHTVALTVDIAAKDADCIVKAGDKVAISNAISATEIDGIIEFSHPASVIANIEALLPLGIPVVVGTTGWLDKKDYVENLVKNIINTDNDNERKYLESKLDLIVYNIYGLTEQEIKTIEL